MFGSLFKKPFLQHNNCLKNFPFKNINPITIYPLNGNKETIKLNNVTRNAYLTPYDSQNDFDSLIVKKPFPKNSILANEYYIINVACFLTLSTIMYYFYKPKK